MLCTNQFLLNCNLHLVNRMTAATMTMTVNAPMRIILSGCGAQTICELYYFLNFFKLF